MNALRRVGPVMPMDIRELSTVLAALRWWQLRGDLGSDACNDVATDGGTVEPLSLAEIDTLCERLNVEVPR